MKRLTVGQSMKLVRQTAGLSLRALSKASGVTTNLISLYERDARTPGLFNLTLLADTLEISIDNYIGRDLTRIDPSGFVIVPRTKWDEIESLVQQLGNLLCLRQTETRRPYRACEEKGEQDG